MQARAHKRALITGASGFVGEHLCAYLLAHADWELAGTVYPQPVEARPRDPRLVLRHVDLRDPDSVQTLLGEVQPDTIFHLAAQSFVPTSFADPWDTLENNIRVQLNLLEAVRRSERQVRVLVVGSNEEYGTPQPGELPQTEGSPLRPSNPYAVSKVAQELLAYQYHQSYGLKVVVTRGFNHTGPRHGPVLSCSSFARQIAEIEAELAPPVLYVGDLTTQRDWVDVRDVVRAYWLALEKGVPGEVYNIGSGTTRTIQSMLDLLLSLSPLAIEVRQEAARLRPSDVPILWADDSKFRAQTGWEPQIPFEQTMRDLLDYWRARVNTFRG